MDETIQQPITDNPEPIDVPEPEQPEEQEPQFQEPEPPEAPEQPEQEPEISLNEEGELNFREDFFDTKKPETPPAQETPPATYSDDELENTPYEQWDINRLSGDVKKYIPYVQRQIQKRQALEQFQQRANTPPPLIEQPQTLSPRDLAAEAQRIAVQKLNLTDPEDFDSYDPEHQAAYSMALQEVQGRYNYQQARYSQQLQEYQALNTFNTRLLQQKDFPEFKTWFDNQLRQKGITGQQVNAGFEKHIKEGGNFRDIQNVIAKWYQDYRSDKAKKVQPKAPKAPYLESSYGAGDATGRNVDLKSVRDLDTDGIANFLMKNGYV